MIDDIQLFINGWPAPRWIPADSWKGFDIGLPDGDKSAWFYIQLEPSGKMLGRPRCMTVAELKRVERKYRKAKRYHRMMARMRK